MLSKLCRAQIEDGFTLIELLVVILIVGILAGGAIPSFLSQAAKADGAQAKTMVSSAQSAMETYDIDHRGYAGASIAVLRGIEPTLGDKSAAVLVAASADLSGQGYTVTVSSSDKVTFSITRSDSGSLTRSCIGGSVDTSGCENGKW